MPALRVLLVDDQSLFRGAVKALLGTRPELEVVGEAEDGPSSVDMAARLRPDVVLMDVTLPGCDGMEATRQIRQANPQVTVLLLSGYSSDSVRAQAEQAGAAGLIDKSGGMEHLVAAIMSAGKSGR